MRYSSIILCILLFSINQSIGRKLDDKTDECTQNTIKAFKWLDYFVLSLMLIVSCGIGAFYGFFSNKQTTSSDFLLGGSSMGTVPMSISLAASFITAIELLGNPSEMYLHGSQYWMICLSFLFVVPMTTRFYLPVFMKLRLTSSYEYLEMRFNPTCRYLASGLYIFQMILYTSVAVYAPALALSSVTGLNVYIAVTVVYIVSIFYASQGGIKAVIMTDMFQASVLLLSIMLIVYFGEDYVGGVGEIWSKNYNTQRLEIFNFDVDPTVRNSFWSVVVGGTFYWLTMFCSNQISLQKYLCVENISQVKRALWFSSFAMIFIYTVNFYTGMIMVAEYSNCDPLKSQEIEHSDEIILLYVVSKLGNLPGVPGLFVSGIFAATLGTVASALNSLAAVTCQDFITGAFNIKMPESKGALWAKWILIIYGAISFGLIFVVEQLGSVLQVAISFNGMVGGITLGLFTLGMFFPWASSKGAIGGGIISLIFILWIGLGQQIAIVNQEILDEVKPVSISQCPCPLNITQLEVTESQIEASDTFFLYKISFLWYSAIGLFNTIIMGLMISILSGTQDPNTVESTLISPPIRNLLAKLPQCLQEKLNYKCESSNSFPDKDKNALSLNGNLNVTIDLSDEIPNQK